MNMLTTYDHAAAVLSAALKSKQIAVVLKGRDDLEFIKLRARQLRDRQLLADATEFQMRVERWLGVLLGLATEAGQIAKKGGVKKCFPATPPATLREIGVDAKMSMRAKASAALGEQAFDAVVSDMRARLAGGRAKIVSGAEHAEKRIRRSQAVRSDCYDFPLADGTPLGRVKLGKIRSRIDHLTVELKILQAVSDRIGNAADALASVEDSISGAALDQIIREAKAR